MYSFLYCWLCTPQKNSLQFFFNMVVYLQMDLLKKNIRIPPILLTKIEVYYCNLFFQFKKEITD